jgi:hypothetical protein
MKIGINKTEICTLDWLKSNNKTINNKYKKSLSIIDLFCGCGGLSLGIKEGLNLNQIKPNFLLALEAVLK